MLSNSFSWITDPLHDGMLTWRWWPHRWVCSKLFNLNRVRVISLHTAGILMWCYSPIYVLTDHQLSLLRLFSIQTLLLCSARETSLLITITCVRWWDDLCQGWCQTLPIVSFLLYLPIVLLTLCISHLCLRILQHWGGGPHKYSTSLLHSCSQFHGEQTWRPITELGNARHKSPIGLSDTEGHG